MPDSTVPPSALPPSSAIAGDAEHWRDRWQIAVQGSRDGIWDWDLVTNAVYFSPQWKRICGYGDDELPNALETWTSLMHPDDLEPTLAQVRAAIDGSLAVYEPEFRMRHKDGTYRWIVARGMVLRNEQGLPVRMAGSHSDISDRRRSHEAIERAFAHQRVLTALLRVGLEDASLAEMLDRALETLTSAPLLATATRLAVYLLDPSDDTLVRVAHRASEAAHPSTDIPIVLASDRPTCQCRRAVATGQLQFAVEHAADGSAPSDGASRGSYCVPLLSDGASIGVLVAQLDVTRDAEGHDDEFLSAVASTLAGMIRRRRTEDELRRARDAAERLRLWAGRKGAFGAMGRIAPDLYVIDAVVPRTKLAELVRATTAICRERRLKLANVFHAGDGNLHPNISYDRRDADELARVVDAGHEILKVCIAHGGSLTGEHGVGLEKLDAMEWLFTRDDLAAMCRVKEAWDPERRMNPGKLIPVRACMETRAAHATERADAAREAHS